jgi:hypothetical protein
MKKVKISYKRILKVVGIIILIPLIWIVFQFVMFFVGPITNYTSKPTLSHSGNYYLVNTVNRVDEKADNYADVLLNIFDKNNTLIGKFNTSCNDATKWASGWYLNTDIVIMNCGDNGNIYLVQPPFNTLETTTEQVYVLQAQELKRQKYE